MQLPDVSKMSPDDCAIDFKLRCKSRRNYPGACSLEYQNLMQIVIECLLNWDMSTNCSKGPGIFGETIAFARADEEQGRGSLHGHWQIWIKELSQKTRDALFHSNTSKRAEAREEFYQYINAVICTTFDSELEVIHTCENTTQNKTNTTQLSRQFESRDKQIFRDSRHKNGAQVTGGRLLICKECGLLTSPNEAIDNTLLHKRNQSEKKSMNPAQVSTAYTIFKNSRTTHELPSIVLICIRQPGQQQNSLSIGHYMNIRSM